MGFEIYNDGSNKVSPKTPVKKKEVSNKSVPIDFKKSSNTSSANSSESYYEFELGNTRFGFRIIDVPSVATYYKEGKSTEITPNQELLATNDGRLTSIRQGSNRGNCYFLAAINALKSTDYGHELVMKNVKSDNNKAFIVKLPGAIKIKEAYQKSDFSCEVKGTYVITSAAIDKVLKNAGKTYSDGDIEVIALELAMESYRAEMIETNNSNNNFLATRHGYTPERCVSLAQQRNNNNFLATGYTTEALFLLTGKQSIVYDDMNKCNNPTLYVANTFESFDKGEVMDLTYQSTESSQPKNNSDRVKFVAPLKNDRFYIEKDNIQSKPSIPSIPSMCNFTHLSKFAFMPQKVNMSAGSMDFESILKVYQKNEGKCALTADMCIAEGDDATKSGGGHSFSVVKVTDEFVYITNPWDDSKVEKVPREDFKKMVYRLSFVNLSNH